MPLTINAAAAAAATANSVECTHMWAFRRTVLNCPLDMSMMYSSTRKGSIRLWFSGIWSRLKSPHATHISNIEPPHFSQHPSPCDCLCHIIAYHRGGGGLSQQQREMKWTRSRLSCLWQMAASPLQKVEGGQNWSSHVGVGSSHIKSALWAISCNQCQKSDNQVPYHQTQVD